MLRELLQAWRGKDMLSRMVGELIEMLGDAEAMFRSACAVVFEGEAADARSEDLYARDGRVNETEWKIRKQIVEHLTINPGPHAPACLALMSVVKDADRVADYAKNLFEVGCMAEGKLGDDAYAQAFRGVADDILVMFDKTRRAFAEEDETLSRELMGHEDAIEKQLDGLIPQLAGDSLPCRRAVVYTLTARHLKRISAHLGNIATAVIMPIDKIDYYDEAWHRED